MLKDFPLQHPMRSRQYPKGVPGMECDVLTCANKIVDNMLKMVKKFQEKRILVSIENPKSSCLWFYPDLVDLVEDWNCTQTYMYVFWGPDKVPIQNRNCQSL